MLSKCGVLSCFVYNSSKEYKLFRVPAVKGRRSATARQQMTLRRSLWATSCGLKDPPGDDILICSRHFVSGKPAQPDDAQNVDWVPSLNLTSDDDGAPGTSSTGGQKGGSFGKATPAAHPIPNECPEVGPPPMAPCCVPGCVNPHPDWVTPLPNDRELQSRWLKAIQIGSGQPAVINPGEMKGVCNMHFTDQQQGTAETGYREPALFVRDNILMQVVGCRLCLNFDTMDHMYDMKLNLRDKRSLQWMAKSYFGQFSSAKEYAEEGFFCERCTVQIDMAHSFWRELTENARKLKWLLTKMAEFGKNVTLPSLKQERFIVPKSSSAGGQSSQPPVLVPVESLKPTLLEPNTLNVETNNPEETNIQVECDPGIYDSSSDADADLSVEQTPAIKVEPIELTDTVPGSTEMASANSINPPPMTKQSKELFKCYLCQIDQLEKNILIHHLMMDHHDHKSLHCQECNESFEKITVFNKHLGMHDPAKRLKCSVCPLRFRKTSAKVRHESARHGLHLENQQQSTAKDKTKKHQCPQCEKAFLYISELRRHEKFKHQGVAIARCEICDKTFASERNLTRHLKLHRGDEKPPSLTTRTTSEIRCNLCLMACTASKDMVTHLKQCHPDAEFETFPCQHCDDVFFSAASRANHNNIHSDIYGCDICGKRHYSKLMLQRHRHAKHAIPMNDDQYRDCPVCDKRYIKGADYVRHMRTHEVEKFECVICGRKFREQEQLRIHERIHFEEKPMECVACGARFGSAASLSRHRKVCSKIERN